MRRPDIVCSVCGQDAWEAHKASWGPVTVYYHHDCQEAYQTRLSPRLRDALVRTLRRWVLQDPKGTP